MPTRTRAAMIGTMGDDHLAALDASFLELEELELMSVANGSMTRAATGTR